MHWLKELGFSERPPPSAGAEGFTHWSSTVMGDLGELSLDCGDTLVTATELSTITGAPFVRLSFEMRNRRVIWEQGLDIPGVLGSFQEAAAWVTSALDQAHCGEFRPSIPTPWLFEGRRCKMLLPQEQERECRRLRNQAFLACPKCTCERSWARPVFRCLAGMLETEPDASPVVFQFDGEVLGIRCGGRLLPAPAVGIRWPAAFMLPAGRLRQLPKRFADPMVRLVVFEGTLSIAGHRYDGIRGVESHPG